MNGVKTKGRHMQYVEMSVVQIFYIRRLASLDLVLYTRKRTDCTIVGLWIE